MAIIESRKTIARFTSNLKALFHLNNNSSKKKPWYYVDDILKRDALLKTIYKQMAIGRSWIDLIKKSEASQHGERVAEYSLIASELSKCRPSSILDVGCVLNNSIITDFVEQNSRIFFLNPSLEKVVYPEYGYFKFPLSEFSENWTFPFVTCLSTIEHFGFDNTRYGVAEQDQGWDWTRCIDEVTKSIEILLSMTAQGGKMIASCPYGCKEFVYHPPIHGVRTAQVLHNEHVDALKEKFGSSIEIITLKLTKDGWVESYPDSSYASYGAIGPGASGLVIIVGKK